MQRPPSRASRNPHSDWRAIRAGILIHLDQNIALLEQPGHDRIAIGDVIHHMAPVAPHSFQIEQHEFMLFACLSEGRIRPRLPMEHRGLCVARRKTAQQKSQYRHNHGMAESHALYTSAESPTDSDVGPKSTERNWSVDWGVIPRQHSSPYRILVIRLSRLGGVWLMRIVFELGRRRLNFDLWPVNQHRCKLKDEAQHDQTHSQSAEVDDTILVLF